MTDIADNIFDLQVALGLDTPAKDPAAGACAAGTIASDDVNCGIYESADGENDDWMYNGEKITDPALFANSDLYYIRLSHAGAHRPPRSQLHGADPGAGGGQQVRHRRRPEAEHSQRPDRSTAPRSACIRRRILRTVIDMRNLG